MVTVVGELLPFAVAIAISPIPVIATILMLMSPRPRPLGLGFLLGWLAGILVASGVFTLLSGALPESGGTDGPQPVLGGIQLVVGAALLVLAVRQWRSRPRGDQEPQLPAWMTKIDSMQAPAAAGLGFLLSAVNPKNLLMAVAAGTALGHAALESGGALVALLIFVFVAGLSVALPVLGYLASPRKVGAALDDIRQWLVLHNAAIMTVLFLVLGAQLLGKGMAKF